MADVDVDGVELDAQMRRARRPTLVDVLWKTTEVIGYVNCIFCIAMLTNLLLSRVDFITAGSQDKKRLDTPRDRADRLAFAVNIVMCLAANYYNDKLKNGKGYVDAETASNWISAHFTIYQYYVFYDFLMYGYVGASFGGKPFGYTLILILSAQMYVVMKIYHLLRR